MTEAEWLACKDPKKCLEFLRDKVSDRKLRLFTVACCRYIWNLMPNEPSKEAVKVAERFADGIAGPQELLNASRAIEATLYAAEVVLETNFLAAEGLADAPDSASLSAARSLISTQNGHYSAARAALYATAIAAHEAAIGITSSIHYAAVCAAGTDLVADLPARIAASGAVTGYSRELCNEVIGNPFRSASIDLLWLTPSVRKLAESSYEERAFPSGELNTARLAVLADALKEAGCQDTDILNHCRGPGPHVRGCWVLDLVRSVD